MLFGCFGRLERGKVVLLVCVVGWVLSWEAAAFDLRGRVVDVEGNGIAEADVWLSQDRQVRQTETDGDGGFAFADVEVELTEVVAYKESFSVGGVNAQVVGSGEVVIVLGEPDDLRLSMKAPTYEPLGGVRVRTMVVSDLFEVPVEDLTELGFPSVRSGDDGQMVIPGLPKGGHVRLVLSHRDYADVQVPYLPVGGSYAAEGKPQLIVMYPGVTLRGRVTNEKGEGVERARVVVYRHGVGRASGAAEVLTDPEGFYKAMVGPGSYAVSARHPDYATALPAPVSLEKESEANVVDLVLLEPHVIDGQVVFPDGAPCGAVPVAYQLDNVVYEETLTQLDGRFRLQVPGGEGRIMLAPPRGYMTETLGVIPVKGELQQHVTLSPTLLTPLPRFEGQVLTKEGAGAGDVLVSSVDLSPPVWAITDEEGRFSIQLDVMPQGAPKVRLRAEHALRFLRGETKASLKENKPLEIRLKSFDPDLTNRPALKGENDLSDLVDEAAPALEGAGEESWFNGAPQTMEELRGKVVVLVFWGGFDERPASLNFLEHMRALNDLYEDVDDVVLVGVHDGSKTDEEVAKYVERFGVSFPVMRDGDEFKTFGAYRIQYIPQAVIVDKEGKVRYFRVDGRILEVIKGLRREA